MVEAGPVVLHIVSTLERGGAETVTLDLIRALAKIGVGNAVVCLGGHTGELESEYISTGASITVLDWSSRPAHCLVELRKLAVRIRPHAVISNLSLPSAVFLLPFMASGVGVRIARIHSDSDGRVGSVTVQLKRSILRRLLSVSSTQILGVSPGAVVYAGGGGRVLGNGVNTDLYEFAEKDAEEKFWAINIGRPEQAKNRRRLISISEELIRRGLPPIRVIGRPGADVSSADEPKINFVGPVAPIFSEYKSAGCLVVVSTREGLPGVVLEALASGVPVVSSRLSGVEMLASSLPGITLLDLEAPDSAWADAICGAFEVRRSPESQRIASAVRRSEFALGRVTAEWLLELGLTDFYGRESDPC